MGDVDHYPWEVELEWRKTYSPTFVGKGIFKPIEISYENLQKIKDEITGRNKMDSLDCDVGGTYCHLCRMQKKSELSETIYTEKWGGGKEYHHCTTYKCGTKFYADRIKSKKTTRVTVGKKCISYEMPERITDVYVSDKKVP